MNDRRTHRPLLPHLACPLSRRDEQGRAEARQHRVAAARREEDSRPRCAFSEMDEFGDYRQVVSLPNPPIEDIRHARTGTAHWPASPTTPWRSCAQSIRTASPAFVAALCLTDVMASVEEAKRAINELGAAGVQIFSARLPAGRSTSPPSSRYSPPWRSSTGRSGCIRHAPRPCRIIRPNRNRGLKCGGASAGLTTRRSPWRGLCSAACSTAIRTSRSSPITSAA